MRKSKITKLLLVLTFCFVTAFFGACGMFHTPFIPTLSGEEVFVYDENGERVLQDGVFVDIGEDTYYVVGNKIVKGHRIIEKAIYDFGEDGKMFIGEKDGNVFGEDGKLVADQKFVQVNENTYYLVNNLIATYDVVIEGSIYFFNQDGTMFVGELDGNVFGEDGKLVVNGDGFVVVNNNTYYIQNNVVVTGTIIINGYIYDFGEDGKMVVGEKDGNVFGEDGKLVGNNVFVVINNNTYYIVNNVVVTGVVVIDGYVYDFGEDGKMFVGEKDGNVFGEDGKLVANNAFVVINNNTYYIVNNVVIKGSVIIEGSFYYFDEEGKMFVGEKDGNVYGEDGKLVGDNVFVVINNNTYYIQNNIVVTGTIIINGYFYDFGEDGKMFVGEKDGNVFGEDGKLVGNNVFVVINNNTYYIVNNVVVTGTIIIDGYIYDFGDDGKMTVGEKGDKVYGEDGKLVADNVFVVINNNTYYIQNNIVVTGTIIIDGYIYDFGDDGKMTVGEKGDKVYGEDGKLVGDNVFVIINNNTYYIVNNIVVHGYIVINGYIYNFNEDGTMFTGEKDGYTFGEDGKLIGNEIFVTINNNTYYIENNVTVTGTLKVIGNKLYVFDEEGKQVTSGEYGDIEFDENGNIVGECVEITVGDNKYYVVNNVVVGTVTVQGVIYESDNDFDPTNNATVANVVCEARIGEKVFTATTNASGEYVFTALPAAEITFTFTCEGYFPASITVDCSTLTGNYTVVIDKKVSNTLTGKVVQADRDTNASNNSPLAGATLTLKRTSSTNVWEYTATTSSSGTYTFTNLTAGVYTLTIEKEGYLTITQTVQVRHNETTVQNVLLEAITAPEDPEQEVQNGVASGTIIDGRTGLVIKELTVYVYAGINNIFGEPLCKVTTDANGVYTTTELAPGNYTAYVVDERELADEDERYASVTIALKVLPGETISGQGANTSNNKGMNIDGMRIVLTWGSTPRDLDSHLNIVNANGSSWHVYYSNKKPSGAQANLDLDDTSSYGPETTTIESVKENTTYKYYVHNWTGNNSTELSNSGAVVKVYFGATLGYTFNVPFGYGYNWDVFSYNSATGEFTVLNTIRS